MAWTECTLSDIGEVVGGATPSTTREDFYGGDIPWITPKDLAGYKSKYIEHGERNITELGMKSCSTQLLPADSVLFSSRAPIGYIAIAKKPMCTNQGFKSVIPNDRVTTDFLYYLLLYNREKIEGLGSGTTFKEVSGKVMRGVKVRVPDIETQKKIASILSSIDDAIETNTRISNNLQKQANMLYKAWFVDYIRFGGVCPDNWKDGQLKDILCLCKNSINTGECPELMYMPIDIMPMHSFAVNEMYPNEEAKSSLITFEPNDIVIGAMRVYFHRVVMPDCAGITRTTCFVLRPFDDVYRAFGLLCCDQDGTIDYAQSTSKGSTMPYAVWEGGLGSMPIKIPPYDVAQDFSKIVLPIIKVIQHNANMNQKLTLLRDSLLKKLLSGDIEV